MNSSSPRPPDSNVMPLGSKPGGEVGEKFFFHVSSCVFRMFSKAFLTHFSTDLPTVPGRFFH